MSISNRLEDILFLRKIEELGLKTMWDFVTRSNPGRGNGYHNTPHMFGAGRLGWKLWDVEVGEQTWADDTDEFMLIDVVVALLWHDYDHSAGHMTDFENIQVAKGAFQDWMDQPENEEVVTALLNTGLRIDSVNRLLDVTEFPFVNEPRFLAEKIVRDADLLYSFADNTGPILQGLYDELSGSNRLPEDMTFLDMIQGQTKFHNEVQLFTVTGLAIHTDLKAEVIREQLAYGRKLSSMENT